MKFFNSSVFIRGLIVGVTITAGLSLLTSHAQEAPSNSTGTFMLMQAADSYIYCINSQTGQVWKKLVKASHWEKDGNPAKELP